MILAAACYALGKDHADLLPVCVGKEEAEPPPELTLGLQVRAFPGSLPETGGLRDQRAGEMQRVILALNIYDAWTAYKRALYGPGGDAMRWVKNNPDQWKLISEMLNAYKE